MASEGRGGGYDAFIDKQSEKRKALSSSSRQEMDQATTGSIPGVNPAAPTGLGDLILPSQGRNMPSANIEDYDTRVSNNRAFLEDPSTKGMMMQFATTMLGGGSPMSAISKAMQMPARMELAALKRTKEERELAQNDRRLDLTERGQNIDLRGQDITAKGTPSELMKTIQAAKEADANGDKKTYNLMMSRAYQIANEFSAPQGQVTSYDSEGNPTITNVPGGKADLEAQHAKNVLEQERQNQLGKAALVNISVDQVMTAIDNAKNPNLTVTGFGGLLNFVPMTESQAVGAAIQQITSNMTVDQLHAIRAASPTGGAFGNISDYEDKLLASTQTVLKQTMRASDLKQHLLVAKFVFDPSMEAQKSSIAQAVNDKSMSVAEGENAYNNLLRDYINQGMNGAGGVSRDFSTPPSYITDPDVRANWGSFIKSMPDEIRTHWLNPEDQASFDQWISSQQGK